MDRRKEYKKLSKGMESSLGIIIGLASRAPLTIFDEPSLGLDAVSRQYFYDQLLADYVQYPRTMIISTHLIDESANLFEEVVILDQGQIKLKEDTETLKQQYLYVAGKKPVLEEIIKHRTPLGQETFGNSQVVVVYNDFTPEERRAAEDQGITFEPMTLQRLFVYLTGKKEVLIHDEH